MSIGNCQSNRWIKQSKAKWNEAKPCRRHRRRRRCCHHTMQCWDWEWEKHVYPLMISFVMYVTTHFRHLWNIKYKLNVSVRAHAHAHSLAAAVQMRILYGSRILHCLGILSTLFLFIYLLLLLLVLHSFHFLSMHPLCFCFHFFVIFHQFGMVSAPLHSPRRFRNANRTRTVQFLERRSLRRERKILQGTKTTGKNTPTMKRMSEQISQRMSETDA